MKVRRMIMAALAAGAIGGALAAPMAASATVRPHVAAPAGSTFSPEQMGWRTTGGQFRNVHEVISLPDLSTFSQNIGSAGFSVQLWSATRVVVLGISTCATTTCHTGDTPAPAEAWNAALAVYDAGGAHALIHADGASAPIPAGHTARLVALYNKVNGLVSVSATDQTAGTVAFNVSFFVGTGLSFNQSRVGSEFSAVSPWGPPAFAYSAPASARLLRNISGVGMTNYIGHAGTLTDSEWLHNRVTWTRNGLSTGAVNGTAGSLVQGGSLFGVVLQP